MARPGLWATRRPPNRSTVALQKRRPNGRHTTVGRYRIRRAEAADVAAVHAIEQASFTDPWSARDFRECVASEVVFLVATDSGEVAGYVIAQDAADEGEILNLAVAAGRQRRGGGRQGRGGPGAPPGGRRGERGVLAVRQSKPGGAALCGAPG